MQNQVTDIKKRLLASHWPKCNGLAEQLADLGTEEARSALIEALSAQRHHVRTAAVRALVRLGDVSVARDIEPLLNDRAFETREEARAALTILTKQRE